MNLKKWIALTGIALAISACAGRHSSPILVERGVPEYEREYLTTKEGYGIDNRLKKIFLAGYIEEGMNQEMVRLLWGPPDREFEDGSIWEFVNREGVLITRVKFKEAEKLRLGIREMVVSSIEGDRYGGSPAPTAPTERESNF